MSAPDGPLGRRRSSPAATALWIALYGFALVALSWGASSTALMDPDEGRNAEVAREMAESGDFVVPHLNGLPYLDKPILFFATAAATIRVLGPTELAARFPSLLSTVAAAALIAVFGWRRFGPATGALAGLALATSPLAVIFGRLVIFDSMLMLLVTCSCLAIFLAWERERGAWWVVAWAAAGLAVLTKGPVGLVLPLLVAIGYGLLCGRPVRRIFHPVGIIVFVLIVAPWFLAVTARQPEFPYYAFVRETFERVATDTMNRVEPPWYFLPLLLGGALPWAWLPLAAPGRLATIWRERRGPGREEAFLLLWIVLPFLFFTISQSKRPGYILPVFPAVALLAARTFEVSAVARRRTAVFVGVLAGIVGLVLLLGSSRIAELIRVPGMAEALARDGLLMGVLVLAGGGLCFVRSQAVVRVALVLLPGFLLLGAGGVLAELGEHRSARALADGIRAAAPDGVRVVAVSEYPASLPFYLETPLVLSTARGQELRSNYIADYLEAMRERPGSTLREPDWWRDQIARCPEPTIYLVESNNENHREALAEHMPLIVENRRAAAFGPCRTDGA